MENHYNMTSTSHQYPAPKHGGRVPNIMEAPTISYNFYDTGKSIIGNDYRQQLVGTIHKATPLNTLFFSSDNIETLQKDIHDQVLTMSGGKYSIDRQSDDDLKLIMRSYYLTFSKNNPQTVTQELKELNSRVVGYASAKIYSEVDFHQFYLKDLQDFPDPIANPMNVGVYGTRTGELHSFF